MPKGVFTEIEVRPVEVTNVELGIVKVMEVSVKELGFKFEQLISVLPNIIEYPLGQVLPLRNPENPEPLKVKREEFRKAARMVEEGAV